MKYKTFEELKEELGDKFEEYMYGANINLLTIIDKALKKIDNMFNLGNEYTIIDDLLELDKILKGSDNNE